MSRTFTDDELEEIAQELNMSVKEIKEMVNRAVQMGYGLKNFNGLMKSLKQEKQREKEVILMTKFKSNNELLTKNGEVLSALTEKLRPKTWLEDLTAQVKQALKEQEKPAKTPKTAKKAPSVYDFFTSARLNVTTKEDKQPQKSFYDHFTFEI